MPTPLRVLVVHGPNLNLLGTREPEIYGSTTLEEIDADLVALGVKADCEVESCQSNHEGVLIDRIQDARAWADGIIINPAGLTHSSVSLRDALSACDLPVVEVHISNVFAREAFRHVSLVSGIALGIVSGLGVRGYRLALEALIEHLRSNGA
jgi:3-dehydroquinate dehydratase-2